MRRWLVCAALLCAPLIASAEPHYVYEDVLDVRPLSACDPKLRRPAMPVVGALLGGLLGNQFGGGSGRAIFTAAGVVYVQPVAFTNYSAIGR